MPLSAAEAAMTSARKSSPKLPVIQAATADLLGGAAAGDELTNDQRAAIQAALAQL